MVIISKQAIQRYMIENSVTLNQVADRADICTVTLKRSFSHGTTEKTAGKLASATGIPVDELVEVW